MSQPEFGRRLRALRLERNLSQAETAGSEMSTSYLSRLESGDRPPTPKIIDYLAKQLNVPRSALHPTHVDMLSAKLALISSGHCRDADAITELTLAVESPGDSDVATRWQALWLLAEMQTARLMRKEALSTLLKLVAVSDELGSLELRVRSRNLLALCHRSLGEVAEAHTVAREALQLAQEGSPERLNDLGRALMTLISVEAELGRLPDARAHADDLERLVGSGSGVLMVEALWTSATVRIRQGDYAGAGALMERALGGLRSHEDLKLWMRLRLAAASLYLQMTPPRLDQAAACVDEAEPALSLIGEPLHEQEMMLLRSQLAFAQGRYEQAEEACRKLEPLEHLLTFRDLVRLKLLRGRLALVNGRRTEGLTSLRELAEEAQNAANVDLAAEIWRIMAEELSKAPTSKAS